MKALLILLALFNNSAFADKSLPLTEVATAFAWMKIAPEFPIIFTSQTEDQVSFRIFDDVYFITSDKHSYKILKKTYAKGLQIAEEVIHLDEITIEKLLKFSKANGRAKAALPEDAFLSSIKKESPMEGFQESKSIFQCKSDLPSRITKNGSVVNEILQHTWIQNGHNESFGMPNTDDAGYFGGLAHIRSPDSFIGKGPKHLECTPVLIPAESNEELVSKNISCLARRVSLSQNPVFENTKNDQDWIAHFDYHALDRNCLVAVRFIMECAGVKAPQVVNAGIGGKLDWNDVYSISDFPLHLKIEIKSLRERLEKLREENSIAALPIQAELLMNEAIEIDSRVRGVTGVTTPKKLKEICELALNSCNHATFGN